MEQILLHLVGDYITQTQWMADNKVRRWWPAVLHASIYALPFLMLGSLRAVLVIWATHVVIDRFSPAKYVILLKNFFGDKLPVSEPEIDSFALKMWDNFGLPPHVPKWVAFPVYVAVDNTMHLLINYGALRWL